MNKFLIFILFTIGYCAVPNQKQTTPIVGYKKIIVDIPTIEDFKEKDKAESFLKDVSQKIEEKNKFLNDYRWELKEGKPTNKPFHILYYFLLSEKIPLNSKYRLFRFNILESLYSYTDVILDRSLSVYDDSDSSSKKCENFKKCKQVFEKIDFHKDSISNKPIIIWFQLNKSPKEKETSFFVSYHICSKMNLYCKEENEANETTLADYESTQKIFMATLLVRLNEIYKNENPKELSLWSWNFRRVEN